MTQLRMWIALLLAWLLVFFNIERFHEPLNIASFVYVLAALIAIIVVALRSWQTLSFGMLVGLSVTTLLTLKWLLGYPIFGVTLPITVTEICALLVTAGLSRSIAEGISEFEKNARQVLEMHFDSHTPSLDQSQAQLYNEVRRARRFGRPLTLFALSAANADNPRLVARYLEEIQQRGIRKYVDARLAHLLSDGISDCDILAYGDGRFYLLCPELTGEAQTELIGRLTGMARRELGLDLQVGTAIFPDQEVTLGGLLEKAAAASRGEPVPVIATPQSANAPDPATRAGINSQPSAS